MFPPSTCCPSLLSPQLSKLKRSYQKLQSKQQKASRQGARDEGSEVARLNGKLEVLLLMCLTSVDVLQSWSWQVAPPGG